VELDGNLSIPDSRGAIQDAICSVQVSLAAIPVRGFAIALITKRSAGEDASVRGRLTAVTNDGEGPDPEITAGDLAQAFAGQLPDSEQTSFQSASG
jgi:hypothetical protein